MMKLPPLNKNLDIIDTINISPIQKLITNHPELWKSMTYRQDKYKPHKNTESIICIWSGSKNNIKQIIKHEPNYNLFETFIKSIINKLKSHFNWKKDIFIYKAMFAKLKANKRITKHTDGGPLLRIPQRIHIPIFSEHNLIDVDINNITYHLKEGTIYNFNNTKPHRVINNSSKDRIHFIIDVSEIGTLPNIEKTMITIKNFNDKLIEIL